MEADVQLTLDKLATAQKATDLALVDIETALAAARRGSGDVFAQHSILAQQVATLERPEPDEPVVLPPPVELPEPPVVVPPSPNPNAMPTTVPAGFRVLKEEDFLTDIPLGGVRDALVKKGWTFYDGFKDTKRVGLYATNRTALTRNGDLLINMHTEAGQPLAFCALPTGWSGQLYGRYEVRFRSAVVPGYKIAWLLWPTSGVWAEGEIDFPEAPLGGTIMGFSHDVTGTPSRNAAWVNTGVRNTDWHTCVIDWRKNSLEFLLDGKRVLYTTDPKAIPTKPMRWTLQCETNLEGVAISPGAAGNIEIAWVRVLVPA